MEGSWFRPPLVKCWPSAVFTVKPYAARWSLIIFLKIFPLRNTTTNHVILWRTLCISYFVLNCCSTLIFFSRKNKTFTEFFCRRSPEMENIQLKCGDYFHSFSNVRRWQWQIRNHRLSYHNFSLIALSFAYEEVRFLLEVIGMSSLETSLIDINQNTSTKILHLVAELLIFEINSVADQTNNLRTISALKYYPCCFYCLFFWISVIFIFVFLISIKFCLF